MKNGLKVDILGNQFWYKDGLRHREDDLPAVIWADGTSFWYLHDKSHRECGPAVMLSTGKISWWLNDNQYSFDEWCIELNKSPKEKAYLALKYL